MPAFLHTTKIPAPSFSFPVFCLQESTRELVRRCYHSWSMKKMGLTENFNFDSFLEEVLSEMKKKEAAEDEEANEMDWTWEQPPVGGYGGEEVPSEVPSEDEMKVDPEPTVPSYKEGMLSEEWFVEHWQWFRRCYDCNNYTYVSGRSALRHKGCRGCMKKGCTSERRRGQHMLLKMIVHHHGWQVLQGQMETIYMHKVEEER